MGFVYLAPEISFQRSQHVSYPGLISFSPFCSKRHLKHAQFLPNTNEMCGTFIFSKISAVPHAGNRRDVNLKATCGIFVIPFWSFFFFNAQAQWERVWQISFIRMECTHADIKHPSRDKWCEFLCLFESLLVGFSSEDLEQLKFSVLNGPHISISKDSCL